MSLLLLSSKGALSRPELLLRLQEQCSAGPVQRALVRHRRPAASQRQGLYNRPTQAQTLSCQLQGLWAGRQLAQEIAKQPLHVSDTGPSWQTCTQTQEEQ